MRKVLMALIMSLVATTAFAGRTVVIANSSPNEGGYYTATLTDTASSNVEVFKTFCLEYGEHFDPGTSYYATIDDTIKNSGATPATLDTVSKQLYAAYLNGSLASSYGTGTSSTFSQLQAAFWAIESGDVSKLSWSANTVNAYKTFSNNLVSVTRDFSTNTVMGVDLLVSLNDVTGYENVKVMNLWSKSNNTGAIQSQIYMDSPAVPAPGAVLLSGLGTVLAGLIRRRTL